MRELPVEKLTVYGAAIGLTALLMPVVHKIPRSGGKKILWHLLYVAAVAAILFTVPNWIQDELFSPGGVLLASTLLPIYSSVVAACSISDLDDRAWLQYWILASAFHLSTEFMDDLTAQLPQAGEHWFEFEFFLTLWLILPLTDGAGLVYTTVTEPYLLPVARKLKNYCEGYLAQFLLTAVNSWYLWLLWYAFLRMPEGQRRFLVVCLGTLYPAAASTVALSQQDRKSAMQQTHWLVYWSCFMLLFGAMDYLENFVGHITGFYSLVAAAVVYLFLPLTAGAEVVFRRVLVPLAGQSENLLLYDASLVKTNMVAQLPGSRQEAVMKKAAELFAEEAKKMR